MSNYKPANHYIWNDRIKAGIFRLMERRIYEVNNKFPLTIRELQQALVPPATLALINTLEVEHGVKNIPTYDDVWFKLPEDPQQLLRPAVVHCGGHKGELELYLLEKPHDEKGRPTTYRPTLNLYEEERMKELYEWVNLAVTEQRHKNLVSATLDEFLRRYADTLWHVMVRWPVLKLGFDHDTRERANDTPRNPERYGWGMTYGETYGWYRSNMEVMKFIDRLLLEASMLPVPTRRPGLRASIETWKKLGDEAY